MDARQNSSGVCIAQSGIEQVEIADMALAEMSQRSIPE